MAKHGTPSLTRSRQQHCASRGTPLPVVGLALGARLSLDFSGNWQRSQM